MKHILQNVNEKEKQLIKSKGIRFSNYNYTSNDIYTNNSEDYHKIKNLINR